MSPDNDTVSTPNSFSLNGSTEWVGFVYDANQVVHIALPSTRDTLKIPPPDGSVLFDESPLQSTTPTE
mgnify:CR=1 FL=1